jgi:ribosome-binding protein aMBF1 (putative translation factor)
MSIYNGTHPSLEESEEEFQQHEPATCELCGFETQAKYLINVAINIHECIDICQDCYVERKGD